MTTEICSINVFATFITTDGYLLQYTQDHHWTDDHLVFDSDDQKYPVDQEGHQIKGSYILTHDQAAELERAAKQVVSDLWIGLQFAELEFRVETIVEILEYEKEDGTVGETFLKIELPAYGLFLIPEKTLRGSFSDREIISIAGQWQLCTTVVNNNYPHAPDDEDPVVLGRYPGNRVAVEVAREIVGNIVNNALVNAAEYDALSHQSDAVA